MSLLLVFAMLLPQGTESPIACNLNALTPAQRVQQSQLAARLKAAIAATEEVDGGYRFLIRASLSPADIFQWVSLETRCCPFLDFEIRLERENGQRRLQLTGRPGVKPLIAAEFGITKKS